MKNEFSQVDFGPIQEYLDNDDIRNLFNESLNDILDSQAETYNTMVSYGWYQINNVDNSKLGLNVTVINQYQDLIDIL